MAGPFTKYSNLQASGPVLYPDSVMGPGTLSVVDFLDDYTFPDGIVGGFYTEALYKTLDARVADFEGEPVTFNYPLAAYNLGVQDTGAAVAFAGVKGRNVVLPDAFKLATGMKHFAIGLWIQGNKSVANGYDNWLAGYNLGSAFDDQWRIALITAAGTDVTKIEFYVKTGTPGWDLSASPSFDVNAIFNSTPNQLVFEYEESPDGTKYSQRFYLNGNPISSRDGATKSGVFYANNSPGDAIIGAPSNVAGSTFTGSFRRAWIEDLSASNRSLLELVRLDYDENVARLRSF